MPKIPVGWIDCPKTAEEIINGQFFCFKTPLKANYSTHITEDSPESFTPKDVLRIAREKFNSKIGLWINLTQTDKYYHEKDIKKKGIEYVKLPCAGGGEFVNWKIVNQFIGICSKFLRNSKENTLIGVHCTHGLNRTGLLVCAFLVAHEKFSVRAAVEEFKRSRPIGIFRQSLIDQLCQRYKSDCRILASPEPSWEEGRSKRHRHHQYGQYQPSILRLPSSDTFSRFKTNQTYRPAPYRGSHHSREERYRNTLIQHSGKPHDLQQHFSNYSRHQPNFAGSYKREQHPNHVFGFRPQIPPPQILDFNDVPNPPTPIPGGSHRMQIP